MTDNHPSQPLLITIHWLRFWAALNVVLSHIFTRVGQIQVRFGKTPTEISLNGGFGVVVFFVISGFIMVHVSGNDFSVKGMARHFLTNRFIRIAPLYWTLTLVTAALIFLAGLYGIAEPGRLTPVTLIKSLTFIPYFDFNGNHLPILAAGWTLNFEMMFYAIFAFCLLFPRRIGLALCTSILAVLAACSQIKSSSAIPGFWCDPIILYFAAGIGLALIRQHLAARGRLLMMPKPLLVSLALATPFAYSWHNPVMTMITPFFAVAAVALATLCQDAAVVGIGRSIITILGNISYAIYLAHGIVLLVVGFAWSKLFGAQMMPAYIASATAGSIAAGYICFRYIERPLARWLRSIKAGKTARAKESAAQNCSA